MTFTSSEIEREMGWVGRVCVCGRAKTVSSLFSGFEDADEPQWIDHMTTPNRKIILHDCFIGPHTVNIYLLKLRANMPS